MQCRHAYPQKENLLKAARFQLARVIQINNKYKHLAKCGPVAAR
jgi:hypothetical protein